MADAKASGKLFGDKPFARAESGLENLGQQRFDNRLPAFAVITDERRFGRRGRHWRALPAGGYSVESDLHSIQSAEKGKSNRQISASGIRWTCHVPVVASPPRSNSY